MSTRLDRSFYGSIEVDLLDNSQGSTVAEVQEEEEEETLFVNGIVTVGAV